MNRASTTRRRARLGPVFALLSAAAGFGIANAARETLPKIEDHLQRALKLAATAGAGSMD
jgi:hypothetical protein